MPERQTSGAYIPLAYVQAKTFRKRDLSHSQSKPKARLKMVIHSARLVRLASVWK